MSPIPARTTTALQVEFGARSMQECCNTSVWEKLVEGKKVDLAKVKVIWTTPTHHDYNWTVRGDLNSALVKKLTDAFLKLDAVEPGTQGDSGPAAREQVHPNVPRPQGYRIGR